MDLFSQSLFVAIIVGMIGAGFVSAMLLVRSRSGVRSAMRRFPWFQTARSVMETLPEAIVGIDGRGSVRSMNESAAELFGYQENEMLGQPISVLIRGAIAFRTSKEALRDSPSYSSSVDGIRTEAIDKDGRSFPVVCFPLRLSARRNQFYVLVRNESQSLREEELQRRCQCLTSALQQFPAPVLIVDRSGRVVMSSHCCEAVFGAPLKTGMNLYALFPGAALHTLLAGETANGHAVRLPDSHTGHLFRILSKGDGAPSGYVVLMGESPRVSRTATDAAAMRRLEDLMTEIGGFSELLLTSVRPDDPMREDLAYVNRASRNAISTLEALSGQRNGHTTGCGASA